MTNGNQEIWKDIKGYDGKYLISNYGRVKSYPSQTRKSFRLMKTHIDKHNKYVMVHLRKTSSTRGRNLFVHRLVAESFIPNPDNLPYVNHKDEDKTNNLASNLEWCNASYNAKYGVGYENRTQKMRERHGKSVVRMDLEYNEIKTYKCVNDVKQDGFHPSSVVRCCMGIIKSGIASGFRWKYDNS